VPITNHRPSMQIDVSIVQRHDVGVRARHATSLVSWVVNAHHFNAPAGVRGRSRSSKGWVVPCMTDDECVEG
jgi:hypothetical protein